MPVSDEFLTAGLKITGHFEDSDDPLGAVSGNFDGMGISLGVFGRGSQAGDMLAIKELRDTLDGKPVQRLDHDTPDGTPIERIVHEIVYPMGEVEAGCVFRALMRYEVKQHDFKMFEGEFVSKDSDQTETAPRKFKLGPLGNLNQVTKGLAKTIRAMADGTVDSQVGARICNGLGIMRACLETQKLEQLEARMDEIAHRVARDRTNAARERTSTDEAQRLSN